MEEQMGTNMDVHKMSENVAATIDSLGNIEMGGIKLNQPSTKLLELDAMSLDVHVAMHPAAVAYYGALKKEAARNLTQVKRAYERWERMKYAEARVKCGGTGDKHKPTQNDVEARMVVDNIKEMEAWDERMDEAQRNLDTLESWFEAWRQKSFAMRDHVSLEEEERFNAAGGSITRKEVGAAGTLSSEKTSRVREIIRQRREREGTPA